MDAVPRARRRPIGATILALVLGWLALAGFGNSAVWWELPDDMRALLDGREVVWHRVAVVPFALAYGVSALVAMMGLWYLRPWAPRAFAAWGIVLIALGIYLATTMPGAMAIASFAFVGLWALLVWAGFAYVRRVIARFNPQSS